ncbi:hypothetical protein PAAG_11276 [Paracoccidioides lutzii Pb01]|uniref:Uncharacterized protein n=1 Tax=Paracoccidioides lutzii (strain ATCC MYA-826 / Pb01) TaxID=502779 RepID=A0A0A2V256_PARBA|nr:hypothetical protein PAAG_11276 [Paracoccidioides lutzii Pb01]KGQ01886.1 hypothetical protein PAAG_11276 [Paracoccidioides lutzii Pb01]
MTSSVMNSPGDAKGSSTVLCSQFLSLRLDERLQFLSWLFEGALASCMPDLAPAIWGDENVRSAGRLGPHKFRKTQQRCFPERTESVLRQRVSTLRKQERGMRTAEPAGVPAASATPGGEGTVALIGSVLMGQPTARHSRMIPTLLSPHGDPLATAAEGTSLLHEFYFQISSSDIVGWLRRASMPGGSILRRAPCDCPPFLGIHRGLPSPPDPSFFSL